MCYSCGWDVSYWHTSKTCPTGFRNTHHQEGCDRGNAKAYINAGHNVRLKGREKTVYPINPHKGQRWRLGEDTGIDNFNYYNVSIDAYPMSTPTIVHTSAPSKNQFFVLAKKDNNDDDTVVIFNKSQKNLMQTMTVYKLSMTSQTLAPQAVL